MIKQEEQMLQKIINRPICADCREVLKYMPDKCVDLTVTDIPYNVNVSYDNYKDKKSEKEYYDMLSEVFMEIGRVSKDNSSIYVKQIEKNIFKTMELLNKIADFKRLIVWINPTHQSSKSNYISAFEIILYYTKGTPVFNQYAERRKYSGKMSLDNKLMKHEYKGQMWNLWDDIPRVTAGALCSKEAILKPGTLEKVHYCQMPLHLSTRAILFSSNENDLVLDPFAGVFTTAVSAKKYNRNFIACDISKKYQEVGIKRLKDIDEQVLTQGKLVTGINF